MKDKKTNILSIKEIIKKNEFAHVIFTGDVPSEELPIVYKKNILMTARDCNEKLLIDCEDVVYKQNLIYEHNLGMEYSTLFKSLKAVAFISSKIVYRDKNLQEEIALHSHLENVCINRGLNFRFFFFYEKERAIKWLLKVE